MIPFFSPLVGPDPYTDEWYAIRYYDPDNSLRPVVFGASEAAAVCGVSPYQTPLHVYSLKRKLIEPEGDNDDKLYGRVIEPAINELYRRRTGRTTLAPCPMYFHPKYNWIAATPDAIALDSLGGWLFPIDCKSVGWQRFRSEFGDEETDEVPVDYIMQAHQQMLVTGCEKQEMAVLVDRRLKIYPIERNEDLCNSIIECSQELRERIIDGHPPEPNFQHADTLHLLKKTYPVTGSEIDLSKEIELLWRERQDLSSQKKDIEKRVEEINARVLSVMKDASVGYLPSGDMVIRSVVKKKAYMVEASEYTQLKGKKR
jgi:putative phage-type endonuclease